MRHIRYLVIALVAFAAASCSNDAASIISTRPPVDHDAEGSWGETPLLPGSEFLMALTESGGAVNGTGTWMSEAGPSGSLKVSGTVANDSLDLQVIFVWSPTIATRADTGRFVGVLATPDEMRGMLSHEGVTDTVVFGRLRIGDPP